MPSIEQENLAKIALLNQRGGRTLSIVDLIEAGTLTAEMAALLGLMVERGESFLTGAVLGGAGKTTLMAAALGFLPEGERIVTTAEPNVVAQAAQGAVPEPFCLLAHEIGSGHWYGYIWGRVAQEFFSVAGPGRRTVSCLHADTPEQTGDILAQCGVAAADLERIGLLAYIQVFGAFSRTHLVTSVHCRLGGEMTPVYRWNNAEGRCEQSLARRNVCEALARRWDAAPDEVLLRWDAHAELLLGLQREGVCEYDEVRARILMALLLLVGAAALGAEPALLTAEDVAKAVKDLASEDGKVRTQAVALLERAGPGALPAIEKAVQSQNRTVSEIAFDLVELIKYGVTPNTPAEVYRAISAYRDGEDEAKFNAIKELAAAGEPGRRALRALAYTEADADVRRKVFDHVAREVAGNLPELVIGGKLAEAESLVRIGSTCGDERTMRDFAVYLLLAGDLEAEIRDLRQQVQLAPDPTKSRLLCHLCRAAGDLEAAERAAKASANTRLLRLVHEDQSNWKALVEDEKAMLAQLTKVGEAFRLKRYGCLATYQRLAGDEAGCRETVEKIIKIAKADKQHAWSAMEILLLNRMTQQAIELLILHERHNSALDLLLATGRVEEAKKLDEKQTAKYWKDMEGENPADALWAKWEWLHARGKDEDARKAVAELSDLFAKGKAEGLSAAALTQAEWQVGLRDQALDRIAALFCEERKRRGHYHPLNMLFGEQTEHALDWWDMLRAQRRNEKPVETLRTLRKLLDLEMTGEEFVAIAGDAAVEAATLADKTEQLAAFSALAESCADYGYPDNALVCLQWCRQLSEAPLPRFRAGRILLTQKRYEEAAEAFRKAWEGDRPHTGQVPSAGLWTMEEAQQRMVEGRAALFLQGWALAKAGKKEEGEKRMLAARLIPLGDSERRSELAEAIERCGLIEQADAEREVILKIGGHWPWDLADFCIEARNRRPGAKRDYQWELNLQRREFHLLLMTHYHYLQPRNYLWAANVETVYRALELLAAGRIDDAMEAAAEAQTFYPADMGTVILLVPELDKAGHKEQADKLFDTFLKARRQGLEMFPGEATHHNNLAWACAKCDRQLDLALKHARRAVELEPDSEYYWDTLAEVHLRRGDPREAIRCEKKSLRLREMPRHWRQFDRYYRALEEQAKPHGAAP